jgi:prolycopene isomerase
LAESNFIKVEHQTAYQYVDYDFGTAMLYGFGEIGFKPFRFLINELEEPFELVWHATLARITFEGKEIIFWPDVERFLEELVRIFPEEKETLSAFYADLHKMYVKIVIKNEVVVPPSEFSPRQGCVRSRQVVYRIISLNSKQA